MRRPGKKQDRLGPSIPIQDSLFGEAPGELLLELPEAFDPHFPEISYRQSVSREHRRRFGQFFTPQEVASLMVEWVCQVNPESVLDPATGTGVFVRLLLERLPETKVTALDVDALVLQACKMSLESLGYKDSVRLLHHDFLLWQSQESFDGIIVNPPYLRHHDMLYEHDIFEMIGKRNDVLLSRLTNSYALFILEVCRRLNPGGRATMVVPGEWLNANFGVPVKEYLLREGILSHLVYFSHAENVFEEVLTTACLLFIERLSSCREAVHTVFVKGGVHEERLQRAISGEEADKNTPELIERSLSADVLLAHPKWNYLLENGAGSSESGFVKLGSLAKSHRGIATGANKFFHLSRFEWEAKGIVSHHALPCVGRASDVEGLIFTGSDFRQLEQRGKKTHLLSFSLELSPAEKRYLEEGEKDGLPGRYLLSKRRPWYAMEKRPPAPIWAAVFGRKELRFIWNLAGVRNLTTFHCLYPFDERSLYAKALVACLNSHVVLGRARMQHRVYGDGLLKFEPGDLLDIEVPNLDSVSEETLKLLGSLLDLVDQAKREESEQEIENLYSRLDETVLLAAGEAATAVEIEQTRASEPQLGDGLL